MDKIEPSVIQQFFMDKYAEWAKRTGRFRPSMNEFARHLGESPVNVNHWINGSRKPGLESAVRMESKLGPEIYDVLGYPRIKVIDDPKLDYLLNSWEVLDDDTRDEILQICEREVDRPPE